MPSRAGGMQSIRSFIRAPALALLASTSLPLAAAASGKDVLALERAEIGDFCTRTAFESGYLTRVDANGDDLPDFVADTGHLICDGSRMAYCGTGGCSHRIWVARRDGGYELAYEGLIFGVRFDRPEEGSFVVRTRSGERRERLAATPTAAVDEPPTDLTVVPLPDALPIGRWVFRDEGGGVAVTDGGGPRLWLACEAGAVRIGFRAGWMDGGGGNGVDDWVRAWDEEGIVAAFEIEGQTFDVSVRLADAQPFFVARETVPLDAPLFDALSRGTSVLMHHYTGMESEGEFGLDGAGDAIRALRASCRSAIATADAPVIPDVAVLSNWHSRGGGGLRGVWHLQQGRPAMVSVSDEAGGSLLWIACERGAARLRWVTYRLRDEYTNAAGIRASVRGAGLTTVFSAAGERTQVPTTYDPSTNAIASAGLFRFDGQVIESLRRGNMLTIDHDGTREHRLSFPLRGSAAALDALAEACR